MRRHPTGLLVCEGGTCSEETDGSHLAGNGSEHVSDGRLRRGHGSVQVGEMECRTDPEANGAFLAELPPAPAVGHLGPRLTIHEHGKI